MDSLSYFFDDDDEFGPVPCSNTSLQEGEDVRTASLRRYSYGVALPFICVFGILGNVLNLIVLTRRNMKGTAYIYMRGYSAAALMAILFAIPFGLRVLIHRETGSWTYLPQAFYHAHLELFLGNGCLGVGVMMLLALTVERYVSVCHPGQPRPMMGQPKLIVTLILLLTFIVYLPGVFRYRLARCISSAGVLVYRKQENIVFIHSVYYSIYKVVLEVVFKVGPTVLLAGLNMRIMVVYRHSCDRRRRMTSSRTTSDEDPRKFAEERRLILLLGSTSILFLVCVSPMVILNVTLSQQNLSLFSYQVFRAIANLLEITNYSITFYIYCLFSEDFRNTLLRTMRWPWVSPSTSAYPPSTPIARKLITPRQSTPPTTTSTNNPSSLTSASSKILWLGCPCWYQEPARDSV